MNGFVRRHAPFLAVFALLGALFFTAIRAGNDWGGDFSVYILEARNIAGHHPLTESTFVATPESMRSHPAVYPPLTSLVIAPVYAVRGLDYVAFKRVLTFFLWLSLVCFYAFGCSRGISPPAMAVVLLLFGLAPLVYTLGSYVGSDALFLCVAGATIYFVDRFYRRGWDELRPITAGCLTAAFLTLCYLTRAAGLALLLGFGAYELWRARRLRRFGVVSVALTAALLFLSGQFLYRGSAYGSQFVLQPRQWLANDIGYLQTPAVLWGPAPTPVRYALSAAMLALAGIGFVRRARKPGLAEFCLVAWLAMLTGYWENDKRYILPMLPYTEMYAAEALLLLAAPIQPIRRRRLFLAGCGAVAVLVSFADLRVFDRTPITDGVTEASFGGLCDYLRKEAPRGSLILSWNPRIFALYTNLPTALYPQNAQPPDFERAVAWQGARYLVVHKREDDVRRLDGYLKYASERLRVAFDNADFRVYAAEPQSSVVSR